jgi:hypothetical protein
MRRLLHLAPLAALAGRGSGNSANASDSNFKQPVRDIETVIASEAKQSIVPRKRKLDCFVASAPRNDGVCRHTFALAGRNRPEVMLFVSL